MMNSVRYLNKNVNGQERENYSRWWREQINHYGTRIRYYTNGYTLTSHNFIYGEDPTTAFEASGEMIMFTNITNDSIMLSKFGIMADCDMTAVVHISAFKDSLGCTREPKAGDLIEMHEYGGFGDRPGFRGAPIYEITERDDQYLELTNSLLGHYVWYIKCKRWEYSYEPGMQPEPLNIQVNDGGDYGRLPFGENPEELIQPYPDSADNSAKCIYDYFDSAGDTDGSVMAGHFIPPQDKCGESPYPTSYPFTQEDADILHTILASASGGAVNITNPAVEGFVSANLGDILTRELVQQINGEKTFVLKTTGKPEDEMIYTTKLSAFDLFDLDGGSTL
jgi:hypothetical protein